MSLSSPPARPSSGRPSFSAPELHATIMRLRLVHPLLNLGYLLIEYACLAAVIGGTIVFCESRASWGIAWVWNVPIVTLAVILIGAMQHRLAGLGHEASHYTLLRDKFWNDLIGDLFCMFPIFSTVHYYRVFHLAHHQYTNDPEHDPDLVNLGGSKMVDRFPMERWPFIKAFYLRAFTEPLQLIKYQLDYLDINVFGTAENIYFERTRGRRGRPWPRLALSLGLAYVAAMVAVQIAITLYLPALWFVVQGLIGTALVLTIGLLLPESAYFPSPFRQPYSTKISGILRMAVLTWAFTAMGIGRVVTGGHSTLYLLLLWLLPLSTSFSFFMLLRDVYQHTNADDGRLTNTRVFYVDPFTRWAVFVYGQDMHVPHHLFPAIPHYRLPALHEILKAKHDDYREQVVECHGTFGNAKGHPSILDTLAEPRHDG